MCEEIKRIVKNLGISSELLGYNYICTAAEMAYYDADIMKNMIDRLYPAIAAKYEKSPSSVERAMRHAVTTSWDKGNRIIRAEFIKKPDNFHLIMYITDVVKKQQVLL